MVYYSLSIRVYNGFFRTMKDCPIGIENRNRINVMERILWFLVGLNLLETGKELAPQILYILAKVL